MAARAEISRFVKRYSLGCKTKWTVAGGGYIHLAVTIDSKDRNHILDCANRIWKLLLSNYPNQFPDYHREHQRSFWVYDRDDISVLKWDSDLQEFALLGEAGF